MTRLFQPPKYEQLTADLDGEPRQHVCPICRAHCKVKRPAIKDLGFLTGVFLFASLVFISVALMFGVSFNLEKNEAIRRNVHWSPVLDEVEIPRYTTLTNGTLFPRPSPSFSRQWPSPENDAAWEEYTSTPLFWLTREEVVKLWKDPNTAARLDREYWGFKGDRYAGSFDISHKIHCVNILRETAFAGRAPSDEAERQVLWMHLSHCADMLVQFLLCNSDPAIITLAYVEGQSALWPDFNVNRQCRNYTVMMEWAKGREIDREEQARAPRPKDAFTWPNPFLGSDTELGFPVDSA